MVLGALNRSVRCLPVVLWFAPTGSEYGSASTLYPDYHHIVGNRGYVGIDAYTHDNHVRVLMTYILPDVPSGKGTYRVRRKF